MRISDLIEKLKEIKEDYGDLIVVHPNGDDIEVTILNKFLKVK